MSSTIDIDVLERRFAERQAAIGIIGMGYVGLPLMLAATQAGFSVLGFDIDATRVQALNRGLSPLRHLPAERIATALGSGRFEATDDMARLAEPEALLICVPTPLGPHMEPDLSFVENTGRNIAKALRRGQLVVLESTTWPGTTREVLRPILEARGLRAGHDFFLAFSPEREDPGNLDFETSRIPKVVGGDDAVALRLAMALYGGFVCRTVSVSSPDVAEAVKITENVFRAVNIALVNELKVIYRALGIDIFEVIDAAKTKPFGFMPFYPGPGLGGHCIPIDPFYLTWRAREVGIHTRFIELAGEINRSMPKLVVERAAQALDQRSGRGLRGAEVLLLGIAYKKNVDDMRESPGLAIWELLEARGAHVAFHDPHVPRIPPTREHAGVAGQRSLAIDHGVLARFDLAIVVTDHDAIDWWAVATACRLIVDTRNVVPRDEAAERLVPA